MPLVTRTLHSLLFLSAALVIGRSFESVNDIPFLAGFNGPHVTERRAGALDRAKTCRWPSRGHDGFYSGVGVLNSTLLFPRFALSSNFVQLSNTSFFRLDAMTRF